MRIRVVFGLLVLAGLMLGAAGQAAAQRSVTVVAEPGAVVWIDDIRYGQTDQSGKLLLKPVPNGPRRLRVRAAGFKELTQPLSAAQSGEVRVTLVKTTDEAELAFQQAEAESDKGKAADLYRKAASLRPRVAEAYLGLARALSDDGKGDEALKAIQDARRARPAYAEASAVEGRIYRAGGEEEKAIASFKRAIAEGKGVQAEANTGLGLLYKDKAEAVAANGDYDAEKDFYQQAAKYLSAAVTQLGGAPDAIVVYQLLGDSYERAKMYPEAIKVYQEFLKKFPDVPEATSVQSFIVQINKRLKEQ